MDIQFKDLVKQAVQEHGMKILEDSRGCKSVLADYARGEYVGEIRLLTTVLEAGFYQEFASNKNHDTDLVRSKFLRRLYTQYSLDETKAMEMVDFLLGTIGIVVNVKPVPVQQSVSSAAMNVSTSSTITRPAAVPAGFVRIEGGTFMMGSSVSEAGRQDDETQHQVTISRAFYMGKYAVTQKEWVKVMGNNPSCFKGGSLPVEQVSWYDTVNYCNARSLSEGLTSAYTVSGTDVRCNWSANGYRLPTEAEWEYACRAGMTTPFRTGNNITTTQANYNGNYWYNGNAKGEYRGKTTAVGSFAANRWGLYNMHGNVWEWCWDWYGSYDSGSQTDPKGAASGADRVWRGGGWGDDVGYLRSAYRDYNPPSFRGNVLGFRLLRP